MKPRRDVDIIAKIRFFRTEDGGFSAPISGVRFYKSSLLEVKGEKFSCAILLDGIGPINPGETVVVPMVFYYPEYLEEILYAGCEFSLWNIRTVASGVVERVFWDNPVTPPPNW